MARLLLPLLLTIAAPALAQAGDSPPVQGIPSGPNQTREQAAATAASGFARFDLNHDGVVTEDELMKAIVAELPKPAGGGTPPVAPMVKAMFDDADTNHDGKITPDEARAAALRGFDEADTNHDGVVTPEERMAQRLKVINESKPRAAVGR